MCVDVCRSHVRMDTDAVEEEGGGEWVMRYGELVELWFDWIIYGFNIS